VGAVRCPMDLDHWQELLRPTFEGRKVIVAVQMAAGATQTTRDVLALGATDALVIATNGVGLGASPKDAGAKVIFLNAPIVGSTMVASIQACQNAIRHLPDWARDEIEAFDPEGTALAVGDFLTETDSIAGRPFLFHRRPEWIALDDKTLVDGLWDRAGIDRSPSVVCPATLESVDAVFDELDMGDGVVAAIDSEDGWTGGGEGVKWIRNRADIPRTMEPWLNPERRVRIMPFLEGVPCSIHGIIFDDYVIPLRPMEMVVLRTESNGLFYVGCSSYYDPPAADREAMRQMAKQVGAQLREEVGFRGAFTIDGIMTAGGFRPTELNPRNGAGLVTMARGFPGPLLLIIDAIAAGLKIDWMPAELERTLVAAFDDQRAGGTWRTFHVRADVPLVERVVINENLTVSLVGETDPCDLIFTSGGTERSVFIRAIWDSHRTEPGPYTAERAAAFWTWADATYGLGVGSLRPSIPRRVG
jgi:hypothetical protein